MGRKARHIYGPQGVLLDPILDLRDLAFDTPPSAPNAKNLEVIQAGTTHDPAWSVLASDAGTVSEASAGSFIDTAVATTHKWNWNTDVKGGMVLAPKPGASLTAYRTFAPTAATRWAIVARVALLNTYDIDDRISLGVDKVSPATNFNDTSELQLQCITAPNVMRYRHQNLNGGGFSALATNTSEPNLHEVLLALVGLSSNAIWSFVSVNGHGWMRIAVDSGHNINGNVNYVYIQTQDVTGTVSTVGIVRWIRFLEGDNTLSKLGFGY